MKKGIVFFIFVIFMMFVEKVDAGYCSTEELIRLNSLGSNVKVNYVAGEEYHTEEPNPESHYTEYILDMMVYNVSSDLDIKLTSKNTNKSYKLNYKNVGPDGAITIRVNDTSTIDTYYYTITPSGLECHDRKLRVLSVTLPKYNYASKKAICDDIPEYYLCQQYTLLNIDYTKFDSDVKAYKEKIALQENNFEELEKNENNKISNTLTKISNYKYIIVFVVIAVGIIATIVVLKKKGSVLK